MDSEGTRYNNYHKHTHYSNLKTLDVIVKPIDFIMKARSLGHTTYFTTEHGWGGNVWEAYDLCKETEEQRYKRIENKITTMKNCLSNKDMWFSHDELNWVDKLKIYDKYVDKLSFIKTYNLKCIFGVEAYYVDNRFEKDRSNYHIILIALNRTGFTDLNRIISESNKSGFYYKNRVDMELLLSLNPKNVIVTTACVGGRLRNDEGLDEFINKMKSHFKDNFYLETQSHPDIIQTEYNKKIIKLHNQYGIKLIHANDSHYINKEDAKYRDMFLHAKGIFYEEEGNFILDYPTYDEIVERYKQQGILTDIEIKEALDNTLIFDKCEDLKIDKEIKMPKVYKNENSTTKLKNIIFDEWKKEKPNIPIEMQNQYHKAITDEFGIIRKTNMEDYFLLDYAIVKRAVNEYGVILTRTGRGSAPSFYINKLLGFTDLDRVSSPITLYPTRFMSTTRILESKSLPDIDLNFADVTPVIKASKDILGEDGIYYMIAYKPLQDSSAFRLWCKAKGLDINEYNEVAKNLDDYISDDKWKAIIEESKIFRGVIESVSPSPCSFLLLDKPISEEVGLIKVGDVICCCLDGYNCDKYKYLKNDYLTVSVWDIISKVYKSIDKPIDTIKELESKLDDKVWRLYEDGISATLNQVDSDYARPLMMKYKAHSIAEISGWVAAIRPGFASLMNNFLERKPYTTKIKELDDMLEDSYHYMLYQESIMKYLIWLGIPEESTYDIIKKISKKKFKEEELIGLKEKLKNGWLDKVGYIEGFEETWQVVNDASKYSFNASHSLSVGIDSVYGAYLKANYPLEYMAVVLTKYMNDIEETSKIISELPYFNINLQPISFRHSVSGYSFDKGTNSIYKGLSSIKFINEQVADELYQLRDITYNSFIDLLKDITKTSCNSRQLGILIKLNFFKEFANNSYLLKIVDIFNLFNDKKQMKKAKVLELNLNTEIIERNSISTDKTYMKLNCDNIIKELCESIPNTSINIKEQIQTEIEFYGYEVSTNDKLPSNVYIISEIDDKYTPKLRLYNLKTGKVDKYKCKKSDIKKNPFGQFTLIKIRKLVDRTKNKNINGEWVATNEKETYLTEWEIIN